MNRATPGGLPRGRRAMAVAGFLEI